MIRDSWSAVGESADNEVQGMRKLEELFRQIEVVALVVGVVLFVIVFLVSRLRG